MYVILTLDNQNGMMFNHRRQSRDRVLSERLVELAGKLTRGKAGRLLMSCYTAGLFPDGVPEGAVSADNFLDQAGSGDVCFVEDAALLPYQPLISQLFVFRWNRDYPSDRRLDLNLSEWVRTVEDEFCGFSHKTITLERYVPPVTEKEADRI